MKPVSAAKFFHWTMLAKPASDRAIYRKIKKLRARSIVEIGLGDGVRAERIVQVAQKFIEMHKRLTALGVKPQLVPGELGSSIRRIANSHTRTDLMIVSAGFQEADLDASWFYIPRMLCAGSFLMLQNKADDNFNVMSRLDIERLAEQHTQRREAAA
jgi:hypothetical protein